MKAGITTFVLTLLTVVAVAGIEVMETPGFVGLAYASHQGAGCPQGYTARFANNRLTCTRTRTEYADVGCPPPTALLNTDIVLRQGRDKCKVPFTAIPPNINSLPNAVCVTMSNDPPWQLQQDVAQGFKDRCTRQITETACPACAGH